MLADSFPKINFLQLPTPLIKAQNLSARLNINLWFKRDDLNGGALGGNKLRKLEYILGDYKRGNFDLVIAAGGPDSNHLRLTAAMCNKLNIEVVMIEYGHRPKIPRGNFLLHELLGPQIIFTDSEQKESVDEVLERLMIEYRAKGRRPYAIPRGAATPVGMLGYIHSVPELLKQGSENGFTIDHIILAVGSCGTISGLCMGAELFGLKAKIWGVAVHAPPEICETRIQDLTQQAAKVLSLPETTTQYKIPTLLEPSRPESAIELVAKLEGEFLDPIFTGPAMAALIDLVKTKRIQRGENVVFIHTGGYPSLFK